MTLLFLDFSGGEFLLIAVVFLMFFGSKSIPDMARTLGKAMREFKAAANSVQQNIQQSSGMNEIKESLNISQENKQIQQPIAKPQEHIAPSQEINPAKPEEQKKEGGNTELPL